MADKFFNNWREFWYEFWQGATKPSLPALLGSLSVASTIFILLVTLLTPDILATKGYGYFLDSPTDDYAYLTSETLRISNTVFSDPSVIVMGSSNTQEAIYANYLAQQLEEKLQKPVTVHKLTAGGLFLLEEICMLDRIRQQFKGLLVLEMTPIRRIAFDPVQELKGGITRHSRLAFNCPLFDKEIRLMGVEPPRWTGNYFIDHYQFFIPRLPAVLRNLITGPVRWSPQNAQKWRPPTKKQWKRAVKNVEKWQETYRENREANFAVYRRLIQLLRKHDLEVAFLESTRNPAAESMLFAKPQVLAMYQEYHDDITQFTQEMKVPYWDLTKFAQLEAKDFIDHTHLKNPKARRRYTAVLATRIAEILPQLKEKLAEKKELLP